MSLETTTASTFALPGTGLTLTFAAGTYTAGAVYRFRTTAPKASVSSIQAAVREALGSNLVYEYIQVAQPTDAAMWAALDALALEAENAYRYIFFLTETVPRGGRGRLGQRPRGGKGLLQLEAGDGGGRLGRGGGHPHGQAGSAEPRLPRGGPHLQPAGPRLPAWVQLGPLSGVVQVAPFVDTPFGKQSLFNNVHALALDQAGFTTVYRLIGRDGWFLVEGRTAAAPTSDYKVIQNRRVMDKATYQVRQALLDFVQWHVDPTDLKASLASLLARANTPSASCRPPGRSPGAAWWPLPARTSWPPRPFSSRSASSLWATCGRSSWTSALKTPSWWGEEVKHAH